MRKARVFVNGREAGELTELDFGKHFRFEYLDGYTGPPVSLTMNLLDKSFEYNTFPPFFEGLLPEGYQLEGLLLFGKVDRNDLFAQLVAVGDDLLGNTTVKEVHA